ncbi:MAG: HPr family phosphocarrier protein [Acutalibacteraceae bacterium]|jgi:phosphocarrier protein HPr
MLEKYIRLKSIDDVKKFVEIASSKDYDITLESDKYIVDAKSIIGVLSLDLTKPLKVVANCKMVAELSRQLDEFR